MKRVKVILINLIILTATSLLMRTIGISFSVYISNKLGPAGIGLFQLVMSIYFLAITFATSGIRLATIRLVTEEIGTGRNLGAKKALHNCLIYSILFSVTFSIILNLSAEFIGTYWLSDTRTILSLRILSFCLPFIAMSSVFVGYFTAVRRVIKASSTQIIELIIRIVTVVMFLRIFLPQGLEFACVAIVLGNLVGEVTSFCILFVLYRFDIRRYKSGDETTNNLISRMLNISLPVAFSSYITASIRTVQQLLIPYGLRKSGASFDKALSTYGVIHGMVMPILMFPSVLLDTISDLIVPELVECKVCGSYVRLNYIITRVFNFGLLSSICVMCIFIRFSNELGSAIYHNSDASYFILIFSPIIPILYLDCVVDSMLKGLGEQVSTMRYNIIESLINVSLVYLLLPKFAIQGYVFAVFFTKGLNFFLSTNRLIKVTNLKIGVINIFKSLICIIGSICITNLIFIMIKNVYTMNNMLLITQITTVAVIYILFLRLSTCITHDDLIWFKSIFK